MRFSVLMSVYKRDNADFLREALVSIYEGQTRKPDEIVVIFDGPLTEALYNVLDEYAQDKNDVVRYFPQEVNKGLGEALRIGVGYCTGDYIFRMDSDDVCHPQRFEKQAAYVEQHPEIDVLGTDISEFEQSYTDEKMRARVCPAKHEDILKMCKKRNPMNHMSVCIKRDSLIGIGGYEPLYLLEDYYLWARMISSGCLFANINESLMYVRIGNGFYSRRGNNARIKSFKVLQKYMLEKNMITKREARVNMLYSRVFTYTPAWLRKFFYNSFLRK